MTDALKQKYGDWALVTGASSGIGEQFARVLAAKGFNLIVTARRAEVLNALAGELSRQHGIEARVVACDLAEDDQVESLIAQAGKVPLGIVISNAGFGAKGEFLKHDKPHMEAMIRTNCMATMKLAYGLLPAMVSRRRGAYVFTGSIEGYLPFPYSGPYAASKAFIHSLGGALWEEMRPHNVDVLVLSPGATDTNAPVSQGVPKENLSGMMQPVVVAEQTLQQLGKKVYFTPGMQNRVFMAFLGALPRKMALRFTGIGILAAMKKK
jgi:short-subunit dehydrogenase